MGDGLVVAAAALVVAAAALAVAAAALTAAPLDSTGVKYMASSCSRVVRSRHRQSSDWQGRYLQRGQQRVENKETYKHCRG